MSQNPKPTFEDIDLDSPIPTPAPADNAGDTDKGKGDGTGDGTGDGSGDKTDPPIPDEGADKPADTTADEPTTEESLVKTIAKSLSIDIADDLSDDEAGLVTVATTYAKQEAQRLYDEMLDSTPLMRDYADFVSNGGDPALFAQVALNRTFEGIELKDDDTATQKLIVGEFLRAKGYSEDLIAEEIADSEAGGTLTKKAKSYLPILVKDEQDAASSLVQQQKAYVEEQQREYNEFLTTVKKTIDSSTSLAGVPLPTADKTALYDYVSKPVNKEGYTQRDLDLQNLTVEQQLLLNYLLYNKLDMNKVTGKLVKNQQALTLKQRLEADRLRSTGQSPQAKGGGTVGDISL